MSHLRWLRMRSCFVCRASRAAAVAASAAAASKDAGGEVGAATGDGAEDSTGCSTAGDWGDGGRAGAGVAASSSGSCPSDSCHGRQWCPLHQMSLRFGNRSCTSPVPPHTRDLANGTPSSTSTSIDDPVELACALAWLRAGAKSDEGPCEPHANVVDRRVQRSLHLRRLAVAKPREEPLPSSCARLEERRCLRLGHDC